MEKSIHPKFLAALMIFMLIHYGMQAQWKPTPGPVGGYVHDILEFNNNIYAGLENGGIFRLDNDEWKRIPGTDWYSVFSLSTFKNKYIIAGVNNGILISSDGINWPAFNTPESFIFSTACNDSSVFIGTNNVSNI